MPVEKRSLVAMFFLSIFTFGIYYLYWTVKTKNELNGMGGRIPTAFLLIIPVANFYFWYKYAQAYTTYIKKGSEPLLYLLVIALVGWIGMFIIQDGLNEYAETHEHV